MTKLEKETWRNKVLYEGLIGVGNSDFYHREIYVDGRRISVNMTTEDIWEVWIDEELICQCCDDFTFLTYLNRALFGEAE